MPSLQELEWSLSLTSAVAKLNTVQAVLIFRTEDDLEYLMQPKLEKDQLLEALSLGVIVTRKIRYGRHLAVRAALENGASWAEIAESTGETEKEERVRFAHWLDQLDRDRSNRPWEGFEYDEMERLRKLLGPNLSGD